MSDISNNENSSLKESLVKELNLSDTNEVKTKSDIKENLKEAIKTAYRKNLQDTYEVFSQKIDNTESDEKEKVLKEIVKDYSDKVLKEALEEVYTEKDSLCEEVYSDEVFSLKEDIATEENTTDNTIEEKPEDKMGEKSKETIERLLKGPEKKKKKLTVFGKVLIGYVALWILTTIIVCIVLYNKFAKYQAGYDAAQNAINPYEVALSEVYRFDSEHIVETAGDGWIAINKYEDDNVISNYVNERLSGCTFTISENEASTERHPSYNVYADEQLVGDITLKHTLEADSYGFHDYELDTVSVLLEGPETYVYTIQCYASDAVYVNGELLSADGETVYLISDDEINTYMAQEASEKSGNTITEYVYVLTSFVNEPEVVLEKDGERFDASPNSDREEQVVLGDEDTASSEYYYNLLVYYDSDLDYDLNDRLYNGFRNASEAFISNMNLWGSFYDISKYLEYGGAAYSAINSAQSGLTWAGRPDEFEINNTEIIDIDVYDENTIVVTTRHDIYRYYRGEAYDEVMTVEWLYCKNGNAWLIRNFSYL